MDTKITYVRIFQCGIFNITIAINAPLPIHANGGGGGALCKDVACSALELVNSLPRCAREGVAN